MRFRCVQKYSTFYLQFRSPESYVVKPFSYSAVCVSLGENSFVLALSHQSDGLAAYALTVVAGVVSAVKVRHVGRTPVGRRVASVVRHASGLDENKAKRRR